MLISEYVITKTNNRNYKKFKNMGYVFNLREDLMVKISDLSKNSRSIVDVKCDFCEVVKKLKYSDYSKNISKHNLYSCSLKCANFKFKKTCLEKFGVEYPLQNKEIKENLHSYFVETYCVNHPSMLKEFELKKQDTNLNKYGVSHQMFIQENISKIKETKLIKYGDENFNNNEKCKLTKSIKYNDKYYNNGDKRINTCLEKYGKYYYNNNDLYKKNCLEKHGVINLFQLEEVKNKIKLSNLEKYGVEYYQSTAEYRNKYKETSLIRYGSENPMQNLEVHNKQQKSGFKCKEYNNILYRGSYELDFIKFCENNKIIIQKPINKIEYLIDNKIHYYFPDFFIPKYNLLIEIKSNYYYKLDEKKNILKKEYSINCGYDFLFIIDKDYSTLKKIIDSNGSVV